VVARANAPRCLDAAVIAEEFTIRPFGFGVAALVEVALEHVLCVRRHAQIISLAFHDGQRRAAQRGDERELVARQAHRRRHVIDWMRADDKRDRQPLTAVRSTSFGRSLAESILRTRARTTTSESSTSEKG